VLKALDIFKFEQPNPVIIDSIISFIECLKKFNYFNNKLFDIVFSFFFMLGDSFFIFFYAA